MSHYFDREMLSDRVESIKLENTPVLIHSSILQLIVQEHGQTDIEQSTIFCLMFFNNEIVAQSAFVTAVKKILNRQTFSLTEMGAIIVKLSIIKTHLLWLGEHSDRRSICLNSFQEESKIALDQQREIYSRFKRCALFNCEYRQSNARLNEMVREIYNIPKRIITFLFNINVSESTKLESDSFVSISTFCRYLRGIHWSDENQNDVTGEDCILLVKRLLSVQIDKEVHKDIYDLVVEELYIRNDGPGYYHEDTDASTRSHQGEVTLRHVLWKLLSTNLHKKQNHDVYKKLEEQILSKVDTQEDNTDIIAKWIKSVFTERKQLIACILGLNIIRDLHNLHDVLQFVVCCGFMCQQYDKDRSPSDHDRVLIGDLMDQMMRVEPYPLMIVKDQMMEIKKFVKTKYYVSEGVINLIFNTLKGEKMFQKAVFCSRFRTYYHVHNRLSVAAENLLNGNILTITHSEKDTLYQFKRHMESMSKNEVEERICSSILSGIEEKIDYRCFIM